MTNQFFTGSIAVVGATDTTDRFGYKVFKSLIQQFPQQLIIPINPNCDSVLEHPCRNSLDDITEEIDTLVMIVNPTIGKAILQKALEKEIKKIWFQPGADNQELTEFCEKNNLQYSSGVCLLFM